MNYHSVQMCECNREYDDDLHKAMKNYFTLDSMGIIKPSKPILSQEDQRGQSLLQSPNPAFFGNMNIPVSRIVRQWRFSDGSAWKIE